MGAPLRSGLAQRGAELLQTGAGFFQRLVRGGIADAEVRAQAKGRAKDDGNTGVFQQRGGKNLVIGDGDARRGGLADQPCDGRIDIERALGFGADDAVDLAQNLKSS